MKLSRFFPFFYFTPSPAANVSVGVRWLCLNETGLFGKAHRPLALVLYNTPPLSLFT